MIDHNVGLIAEPGRPADAPARLVRHAPMAAGAGGDF